MQRKNGATNPDFVLTDRSNPQLLAGAKVLAGKERRTSAHLIAHLAEIHARELYLKEGFPRLSVYCIEALGLSEDASYRRADAAILARRFPIILDMLAEGSIHLTTIRIIGGYLTEENHKELLEAARGKSKQQLELLKATLFPSPDIPTSLRKVPDSGMVLEQTVPVDGLFASEAPVGAAALNGSALGAVNAEKQAMATVGTGTVEHALSSTGSPTPTRKAVMAPLSPERYNLHVMIDAETYHALRELQDLRRHQVPNGELATILRRAVLRERDQVKRERFGLVERPRKKSRQTTLVPDPQSTSADNGPATVNTRHVPAAVKRAVWRRDGGCCAFVGQSGRRCSETGRLEFHHVKAYSLGGLATVENIALRCRAHNVHEGVSGKKVSGASASDRARTHGPEAGAATNASYQLPPG
jgi:hypothetical protein